MALIKAGFHAVSAIARREESRCSASFANPLDLNKQRTSAVFPIRFALFNERAQTFLRIFEAIEFVEENVHGVLEAVTKRQAHAAENRLFRHGEDRSGVAVDAI